MERIRYHLYRPHFQGRWFLSHASNRNGYPEWRGFAEHTTILGTTEWIGFPQVKKHGAGPIILQSHGDPSEPISFRNIWIREL